MNSETNNQSIKSTFVLILRRVLVWDKCCSCIVGTCTRAHISIRIAGGGPRCHRRPLWTMCVIPGAKSVAWSSVAKKNSIMYEDERNVGKEVRSALWCISLIYYLADFQALILSTLEEESPPPPPTPPLSCSTCDIMAGLSAFSMGYNTF